MIHSNTFAALFDLDKLDRDIERALFSTFSIPDQTFNTFWYYSLWFSAPFYALRLLQLQTISVAAVILHRHRRHGKEKDRTRLFYSSFSSIIEFRASVVSITRAFSNFPAAVLPYLWIRVGSRALLFRLPLSCRIVNTSRLARFSLWSRDSAKSRKAFPFLIFLFAQRITVILSPESLIAWPEFLTTGHARSI